jgi:hypothetical protein
MMSSSGSPYMSECRTVFKCYRTTALVVRGVVPALRVCFPILHPPCVRFSRAPLTDDFFDMVALPPRHPLFDTNLVYEQRLEIVSGTNHLLSDLASRHHPRQIQQAHHHPTATFIGNPPHSLAIRHIQPEPTLRCSHYEVCDVGVIGGAVGVS